jgi:group I intron endonuclease
MGTIYILENKENHKCYVGQTTKSFRERFRAHQHSNSIVGRAISKYGSDNFERILLENIPEEELDYWEQHYIQECNSLVPNGYNLETGGHKNKHHHEETKKKLKGRISPMKGKRHTEESLKKMSEVHIGNKYWVGKHHNEESKKKIGEAGKGRISLMKGRIMSNESRKKMSEAKKGKPSPRKGVLLTEETKRKLSEAHKNPSIEIRKKMSEAHKGQVAWNKGKVSIIRGEKHPMYGKHHTEETKQKISNTKKMQFLFTL